MAGLGVPVGGGAGLAHRFLRPEDCLLALTLTRPGHRGGLEESLEESFESLKRVLTV